MVVALGPGRFYGSSLPRPRFFPGDRVDPPPSVTEPLLAWAQEAHWSMGGLGVKHLRVALPVLHLSFSPCSINSYDVVIDLGR